ncbi:MAG: hypothetical protein Q8M98_03265 [Candidatus Cloacimonadaceae bacterium]|nr:hypothetical protein [Candidatus Cloacimonadaceae bacterium]MDP3113775.1 hypothetical protein [Candidatus Cloacimonadaceae bacterium]
MNNKDLSKYNKLCARCRKKCKQEKRIIVISCPRFVAEPVQLMVKLKFPPGRPKKL